MAKRQNRRQNKFNRVTVNRLRDSHTSGSCSFTRLNVLVRGERAVVDICPSCGTAYIRGPLAVYIEDPKVKPAIIRKTKVIGLHGTAER